MASEQDLREAASSTTAASAASHYPMAIHVRFCAQPVISPSGRVTQGHSPLGETPVCLIDLLENSSCRRRRPSQN